VAVWVILLNREGVTVTCLCLNFAYIAVRSGVEESLELGLRVCWVFSSCVTLGFQTQLYTFGVVIGCIVYSSYIIISLK
jgi:hypothetical protein